MKRVYWVGMLKVTQYACRYYQRWIGYLPVTLRAQATTVLAVLEPFCLVLLAYDKEHARGKGDTT